MTPFTFHSIRQHSKRSARNRIPTAVVARPRRLTFEHLEDRRLLAIGDVLFAIGSGGAQAAADGDLFVVGGGVFNIGSGEMLSTLRRANPQGDWGYSVAISGNLVVAGAPYQISGEGPGAAYIFDASTGNLLRTLNNPTPENGDQFGMSVAISGTTVVVGAPWNRVLWGGSIYVYDGLTGNLLRTIDNPMESIGAGFGENVAISGNIVAGAGFSRAAAFNVATGQMLWSAPSGGGWPNRTFLGASGSLIAVGASVFDAASGTLLRQIANPGPGGDDFGGSVALSGTTLLVGARDYSYPDAPYVGIAYAFDATTGDLIAALEEPGLQKDFGLGWSVAVSGARAIVGGTWTGPTYVYDVSGEISRPNPTTFTGTSGDDRYEFMAAGADPGLSTFPRLPTLHQLSVGPVIYYYDAAAPVSFTINGGAGSDRLEITGGRGTDSATIYRYAVRHTGPGTPGSPGYYSISASNIEDIRDYAGAGTGQRATLYDGPDHGDVFTGRGDLLSGWMRSATGNPNYYSNYAEGYDQVYGLSTSGSVDEAVLYGSDGNDSMRFEPGNPGAPRAYITRPGAYFIFALNFKKVTGYAEAGNDAVAFFDTPGSDIFTASPTQARLDGPAGSNILNIALGFDTVRAYSQVGGYDKAYLTGTTGDDTFLGFGMPRTTYPSGMGPGYARLAGTGYSLRVATFDEVYANLLTGNDTANLYDGTANDYFWAKLGAAVLTDGTVHDTTGDLVTPNTYYYKVYGFDSAANDHVNLYGTQGGTNTKRVITPLDYILATYGSWIDAP